MSDGAESWITTLRRRLGAGKEQPIPIEVVTDVQTFLKERTARMDDWFCLVRVTLGIGLAGYLAIDALGNVGQLAAAMLLLLSYVLANIGTALLGRHGVRRIRWGYAALDVGFLLLMRHIFFFEALVDPNATLAGLFTLLLMVYTIYSDPRLSGALALATLLATGISLWLDARGLGSGHAALAYRTYPLRGILLFTYLGAASAFTFLLARRLRHQVLRYSIELHKRLQAALTGSVERTRREKLEELNRLKQNFIGVLSHELRTPVAPLRSSLEILRSEVRGDANLLEMVDIALEAAGKLQRLALDYSQLAELLTLEQSGLLRRNIRIDTLMQVLLESLSSRRVVVQNVEALVVSADPRLLGGAILSLLRRAEYVTPVGQPIEVRACLENNEVVLSIHDPESVLDPEIGMTLDDPFGYSSERTHFSNNTGLELTLARHSLRRLGGRLRIDSRHGNGTTVYCTLPGQRHGMHWANGAQLRFELAAFGVQTG